LQGYAIGEFTLLFYHEIPTSCAVLVGGKIERTTNSSRIVVEGILMVKGAGLGHQSEEDRVEGDITVIEAL